MPKKADDNISLEEYMNYCLELCSFVNNNENLKFYMELQERSNYLKEIVDDNLADLKLSKETEAKVGHKTVDTKFYGYKTHLAISEDGLITAVTVSTGEKSDGQELMSLIEKSETNGMEVKTVVGEAAYSSRYNIENTKEKEIQLVAKLNKNIISGKRNEEDKFEFNKDASMYVCPSGHMAIRKAKQGKKALKY